jgi:hypothetical protein
MSRFFQAMAPMMMQKIAPSAGAVGGVPLLMMLWDLIGGSHGKNLQTVFGKGPGNTGSQIGAAAGAAAPEAPAAPATPAAPGSVAEGYDKARTMGPATPAPATPNVGEQAGQQAAQPPAIPEQAMGAFRTGSGISPTGEDFGNTRAAIAETEGRDPTGVTDDQVWNALYGYHQNQWASNGGKAGDHDGFAASFNRPGGTAPSPNSAQQFRQWFKDNTTANVNVPGTQVDAGRVAADVGGNLGLNAGVNAAAKSLGAKAPGLLPVTFGLDGLDLFGANPLTDRFGQGAMGTEEALRKGEQTADMSAPMRALTGLSQPLTTLYSGGTMAANAASDMGGAMDGQAQNVERERQRMREQGANAPEPSIVPNGASNYFFSQNPDGSYRKKTPGESLSHIHDRAWQDSKVPGLNYLQTLAEANSEGALGLQDQWRRLDTWREWSKNRQQELAAKAPTDPAAAQQLQVLQQKQEERKSTVPQNLYRNVTQREFVHPFKKDFWQGNFHAPWSSDVD